jgi:hypothetical protein
MTEDRRTRLSLDVTDEQMAALDRYIPWGMKKRVFSALIDLLIKAFERGGAGVLVSVLEKELDLPGLFVRKEG